MDPAIKHRRIHEIQYHRALPPDDYGDVEYAPDEDVLAYQYGKVQLVTNLDGKEVVSNRVFIVDTIFPINWGDELTYKGQRVRVQTYAQFDGLKAGTGTTVIYT